VCVCVYSHLPPALLEQLLLLLDRVVLGEVAPQRAHHDHGDDAGEQQHDDQAVEDREPVHLWEQIIRISYYCKRTGLGFTVKPGGRVVVVVILWRAAAR